MIGILLFLFLQVPGNAFSEYHIGKPVPKNDLNKVNYFDLQDFSIHGDYIYVADFRGKHLYVFDKRGQLVRKTGGSGKGPGEFVHGPRIISPAENEVFILGMMPYLMVYDTRLNYNTNTFIFENMFSMNDMVSTEDNLVFAMSSFFEEHIAVYDRNENHLKTLNLGFELKAGMLNEFKIHSISNNRWLFTWPYQNQFKIYDHNFVPESEFSISGLPSQSKGRVIKTKIPGSATRYRKKMYKAGTFVPSGSFFTNVIMLNQQHLMVQLGDQTGGAQKALIVNTSGEILQKIGLPVAGKILGYSEEELYMLTSDSSSIVAFHLKISD